MATALACPNPNHDAARVALLEELVEAARPVCARLPRHGRDVEILAGLAQALEAVDCWAEPETTHQSREGASSGHGQYT